MQHYYATKIKYLVLLAAVLTVLSACKKSEQPYRPGIAKGTRFQTLTFNGFALDSIQVRIGPRSTGAGYLFEDVVENTFAVPFDTTQNLNRVVLYQKDGSKPYEGSQFRFEDRYRDTGVVVLYDGKTIAYNPVLPKPAMGKMGLRISFRSTATNYKGAVDLELHEMEYRNKDTVVKDPVTNKDTTITLRKKVPKPQVAYVIKGVKPTELSSFIEVPAPKDENIMDYAFYILQANTRNGLNYPANLYREYYFDSFSFTPDYTQLITVIDARLVTTRPNRIIYETIDHSGPFLQASFLTGE